MLNDTTRTWNGCRAQCNTEGGELASIKSRHEWDVVKGKIIKYFFNQSRSRLFDLIYRLDKSLTLKDVVGVGIFVFF